MKYLLKIKTNKYTGNFNRELCAYAFCAYYDNLQHWIDELHDDAYKFYGDDAKAPQLDYFNDDHGVTVCKIPNNSNDLDVFFEAKPSKALWKKMAQRINGFAKNGSKIYDGIPKDLKIKSLEWFSIEEKIKKISI